MGKILVNLAVPAISDSFDIFVPSDLAIHKLIPVIADGVRDITDRRYNSSSCEMLMRLEPALLLNPQNTLGDYDIHDGAKLMLL